MPGVTDRNSDEEPGTNGSYESERQKCLDFCLSCWQIRAFTFFYLEEIQNIPDFWISYAEGSAGSRRSSLFVVVVASNLPDLSPFYGKTMKWRQNNCFCRQKIDE